MNNKKFAYQQGPWSLADLFPSAGSSEMTAAMNELEKKVAGFEGHRASLDAEMPQEAFMRIIRDIEEITRIMQRISGYAELRFAEDTQDQEATTLVARMEQMNAELSNRTMFFSLWWKSLDDSQASRLMAPTDDYRYWLEEMRHFKPYTLSEPEEKIINIKDVTGSSALVVLYDAITNRYSFKVTVDGVEKELTRGELMTNVRMPDANMRASAYRELYRVYGQDGPILGQMYQTLVRDWRNEVISLRGYNQPISARNLHNDIPDGVVDTLLSVCEQNRGIFQRFFKLKARLLNMEKLRRYDIYAPLAESARQFGYDQAVNLIMDAFSQFDPRFADLALKVIREEHVDSEIRKGKRSGAFCATINPDLTPWILANYQGNSDDVATLAHELGHAIHSLMASQHSIFTQHACLPLAETASTFGEMMLVERLLSDESDADVRRDLLFRQVDDAYATIMRQAFFALFEKTAHEMIDQGTSVDALSDAYYKNLQTQFGDVLDIGEEFRWEWVSIPHIYHVPFYVYAYAFGQLLVLSLYKQYQQDRDGFKPRYMQILSTGGSQAPMDMLSQAGFDVSQASFWQGGFDVVDALVRQLENMAT